MKMTRGSSPYKSPGARKMAEGGSVDKPKRKIVTTTGKEITGKKADKIRAAMKNDADVASGKKKVKTGFLGLGNQYRVKQAEAKPKVATKSRTSSSSAPKSSVRPKARTSGSVTKYKTSDQAKSEAGKSSYKSMDAAKAESTGGDRKTIKAKAKTTKPKGTGSSQYRRVQDTPGYKRARGANATQLNTRAGKSGEGSRGDGRSNEGSYSRAERTTREAGGTAPRNYRTASRRVLAKMSPAQKKAYNEGRSVKVGTQVFKKG